MKKNKKDAKRTARTEPKAAPKAKEEQSKDELSEEDLEGVSGGTTPTLMTACASGKHYSTATITVK
jgi:hypothetical protein